MDIHHTRLLTTLDVKNDHLIVTVQHSASHHLPLESKYRALEMILELASIPLSDKLNLHKAIGEMFHTEVLKHTLVLEKAERKLTKMSNTMKMIRGKGIDLTCKC